MNQDYTILHWHISQFCHRLSVIPIILTIQNHFFFFFVDPGMPATQSGSLYSQRVFWGRLLRASWRPLWTGLRWPGDWGTPETCTACWSPCGSGSHPTGCTPSPADWDHCTQTQTQTQNLLVKQNHHNASTLEGKQVYFVPFTYIFVIMKNKNSIVSFTPRFLFFVPTIDTTKCEDTYTLNTNQGKQERTVLRPCLHCHTCTYFKPRVSQQWLSKKED